MEFFVNLMLIAASLVVLVQSSGYTKLIDFALPAISAVGIIIVAVLLMIKNRKKYVSQFNKWKAKKSHKISKEYAMILISIGLAIVYMLLIMKIDFYIASFIYLVASYAINYVLLREKGERCKAIMIRTGMSVVVCVAMYVIFKVLLHVNVGI